MGGLIGMVLLAIVGVLGWMAAHIVPASGKFQKLEPTLVDQCRRVDIAPGTEDVQIDPDLGLAFISATDRRAATEGAGVNPLNGIYTLSLDGADTVRKVSPPLEDFLPHGISLWTGPDGARRLFAINHPRAGGEFVEIFDMGDDGMLIHSDRVSFEAMYSPNDLVAVGPNQFYVTNDQRHQSGPLSMLESYLALPLTSVAYFDGESGRDVATRLTLANGINISRDGETVYVAELLKRRISVYDRDRLTNDLAKRGTLKVATNPDNIDIAPDGALFIGGHPRIFDLLKHVGDETVTAPSHVVRLDPASRETRDVFVSLNGEINGSSVGAVNDDTLIIGAVFDGHVMVCPLK